MTIRDRVQELADADGKKRAGGGMSCAQPAAVDLLAERDGRVWFVFDCMILHSAQSGSDWYDHVVCAGTACVAGDALADAVVEVLRNDRLTEHEVEWATPPYDRAAVARADGEAWWARVQRGPTP